MPANCVIRGVIAPTGITFPLDVVEWCVTRVAVSVSCWGDGIASFDYWLAVIVQLELVVDDLRNRRQALDPSVIQHLAICVVGVVVVPLWQTRLAGLDLFGGDRTREMQDDDGQEEHRGDTCG